MSKQLIFQNLDKLNEETELMLSSIQDLNEEELHDGSNGWSVIQVLSHLNMAEAGSVLYMRKKMQAGQSLPAYSMTHKLRFLVAKGFLQSSLRWKAPKVVANPKGDYTYSEIREAWAKTREATQKYIDEYPEELLSKAVYKHPFAGRLDLKGAIGSFIYHQRHHVHQIRRIRKKIGR